MFCSAKLAISPTPFHGIPDHQAMARDIGALDYIECSALSGAGVDDVIDTAMWALVTDAQTERGKARRHWEMVEICFFLYRCLKLGSTVDGRNPTPIEVGSLSRYLQGFSTIPGGCLGFLNHQQYGLDGVFWWSLGILEIFCSLFPWDGLRHWSTMFCVFSAEDKGNIRKQYEVFEMLGMQHDRIVNICVYYILVPYMYHTKRLKSSILDIQRLVKQDCFAPESRSRLPSNVTIFDDLAKDMSAEKKIIEWSSSDSSCFVGALNNAFALQFWLCVMSEKILFWWCFILVNPAVTWHQL